MGTDGHKDAEELRRARSSKGSVRCSLPLDIDRNLCAERRTDTVSDNYMERLILLTSNARSWRASDDETVDLTEPRFESFCLANAKPVWQKTKIRNLSESSVGNMNMVPAYFFDIGCSKKSWGSKQVCEDLFLSTLFFFEEDKGRKIIGYSLIIQISLLYSCMFFGCCTEHKS